MNIDEAIELRKKALSILREHLTTEALQWLMDRTPWDSKTLGISVHESNDLPEQKKDGKQISKSICFEREGNKYELYFFEFHQLTQDFCLYFNGELVLQTTYSIVQEESYGLPEEPEKIINFNEYLYRDRYFTNVELLKLSDWVEEIPKFVEILKNRMETKEKEEKIDNENQEAEKTKKQFDLGKFK